MKRITALVLTFILILSFAGCNKTEYTLQLPAAENGTYIILDKSNDVRKIETAENIYTLTELLTGSGRTTATRSRSEIPSAENYLKIDVVFTDTTETLFVYEKDGKYYMEQPLKGVYELTDSEYAAIDSFYVNLKQEVSAMETDSLKRAVKKLNPLDRHGKSFAPSELTNRELLRYGFLQFGPKGNGFADITFETLNRTYIKGSFGIETALPEDITCFCGQVLANYNSTNDTYTWDKTFHYVDHLSETFNEIKDVYKIEDKFYVELYKIFPDLLMNSSVKQYNFYPTYNDASAQENVLFSVTNSDEFSDAVNNLDDSAKTVYRLTFVRDGSLKLINYEILNNAE